MTFLEKAVEIEKSIEDGVSEHDIPSMYCPSDYRFEGEKKCNAGTYEECKKCWNREMPNTEAEKPLFPTEDFNAGYDKGLNDAWEVARKIYSMDNDKKKEIIGNYYLSNIFERFTPQEALTKMKAYEEAQIEVGDVVKLPNGRKGVATFVLDEEYLYVMDENGLLFNNYKFGVCKKTGRKVDIKSLLEQIGE